LKRASRLRKESEAKKALEELLIKREGAQEREDAQKKREDEVSITHVSLKNNDGSRK
jgi:hypothetical protein